MSRKPLISRLPDPANVTVAILDVQEKLIVNIANQNDVIDNCTRLAHGASLLGARVIVTEQYPKGLGPSVSRLREALDPWEPIEKRSFTACTEEFNERLGPPSPERALLIAGVESHVCVMQTVLDTLDAGWNVGIVVDATGSRSPVNYQIALERMMSLGVTMLSTEMILFELMKTSTHPAFKDILQLVK